MKVILQRVKNASVTRLSDNTITGEITKGLFLLVGFKKGDTVEAIQKMCEKILKLRVMADSEGKMNISVLDAKNEILVVSQFTLYANTEDGRRPSFIDAESPDRARELYTAFVDYLNQSGLLIKTGSFGDYMKIDAELDGPVTITLEE